MLKEAWESNAQGDKNVVSHVLLMRERMEKMASLVQKNVKQAQTQQKHWYDQTAQQREFVMGDQVLLLLPTSTSKLMAQWQGPYQIVKSGELYGGHAGQKGTISDISREHVTQVAYSSWCRILVTRNNRGRV